MMNNIEEIKVTDLLTNEMKSFRPEAEKLPGNVLHALKNEELFIAPGLTDLQLNGLNGIDLNDDTLTPGEVQQLVHGLLKEGITTFLPTVITNNPDIIERNIGIINEAARRYPEVSDCMLGFHVEGPFISRSEGARGAHPVEWIREPDIDLLLRWQTMSGNRIRLLTLSPEYEDSIALTKACVRNNILVAIGHTNASPGQIEAAVKAGASLSTHLGNGMHRSIHRHHNTLFTQLGNDELFASIITDGHHIPDELIRIIIRSKLGKSFLVSDATAFAGMEPGNYMSPIGREVHLDQHKRLSMKENDAYLAGSASSLFDCVNYLQKQGLVSPAEAWKMGSVLPLQYLNRNAAKQPDISDDFVLLTIREGVFHRVLTHKQGRYFLP